MIVPRVRATTEKAVPNHIECILQGTLEEPLGTILKDKAQPTESQSGRRILEESVSAIVAVGTDHGAVAEHLLVSGSSLDAGGSVVVHHTNK